MLPPKHPTPPVHIPAQGLPTPLTDAEVAECELALHAAWQREHGSKLATVRPKRR